MPALALPQAPSLLPGFSSTGHPDPDEASAAGSDLGSRSGSGVSGPAQGSIGHGHGLAGVPSAALAHALNIARMPSLSAAGLSEAMHLQSMPPGHVALRPALSLSGQLQVASSDVVGLFESIMAPPVPIPATGIAASGATSAPNSRAGSLVPGQTLGHGQFVPSQLPQHGMGGGGGGAGAGAWPSGSPASAGMGMSGGTGAAAGAGGGVGMSLSMGLVPHSLAPSRAATSAGMGMGAGPEAASAGAGSSAGDAAKADASVTDAGGAAKRGRLSRASSRAI